MSTATVDLNNGYSLRNRFLRAEWNAMNTFLQRLWKVRNVQVAIFIVVLSTSISASFSDAYVYAQTAQTAAPDRSKSPLDIPSAPSAADKVVVTLVTEEVLGQLANGVTYTFWTFNGTVPGVSGRVCLFCLLLRFLAATSCGRLLAANTWPKRRYSCSRFSL